MRDSLDQVVVSVRSLAMSQHTQHDVHTAQLLEELLLLLTVRLGELLETSGQAVLHILENAGFGVVRKLKPSPPLSLPTSSLQILQTTLALVESAGEVLRVRGDLGVALLNLVVEYGGHAILVNRVKCVHYA